MTSKPPSNSVQTEECTLALNGVSLSGADIDGRAAEAMNSMDDEVLSRDGMAIDEAVGNGLGKGVQRDADGDVGDGEIFVGKVIL